MCSDQRPFQGRHRPESSRCLPEADEWRQRREKLDLLIR